MYIQRQEALEIQKSLQDRIIELESNKLPRAKDPNIRRDLQVKIQKYKNSYLFTKK